jgi:uncharacterized protein YabE (DUF348 family)
MRRSIAVAVAGATAAASLMLGITSASASTKYVCTKKADGKTVTVTVHKNRAEDALEHRGFTCTGDTH